MKRFFLGIATLVALTFSVASSALTLQDFNGNSGDAVYDDTGAQYVQVTDVDDPASTPMIQLLSDVTTITGQNYIVGIFDRTTRVELDVLDTFANKTASNIIFDIAAGTATAFAIAPSVDGTTAAIGDTFGFYIKFYADLVSGTLSGDAYYSDDSPTDLFSIFYDADAIASANQAEVALGIHDPAVGWKALISVQDVAPVPLPAAAWLFGSALIGLLGLGRRRATSTGATA